MVIDLDANSTYSPTEEFQEVINLAWRRLGNPSSLHRGGQRARAEVERAREAVRYLVGASKGDKVIFTSGATEANNTVIGAGWRSLAVSAVEHPCVLAPARRAFDAGAELQVLPVSQIGHVEPRAVRDVLAPTTELVSVMAANNETGVENDLTALAEAVREVNPRALLHTDAAQVLGKRSISFSRMGVDLMTLSGHKFGALSGVGALVVREGVRLNPLLLGGSQEEKLRGGTENVLGIVSLGEAARVVSETVADRESAMQALRDGFESGLAGLLEGVEFNSTQARRLPNTSSVYLPGVRGDDLVVALDLEGILVSYGAACSSGKPEPSHVLLAMGQSEQRVRSTIRVSFRADQSLDTLAGVVSTIARVVARMRSQGLC